MKPVSDVSMSFMEHFAEENENILHLNGAYDPMTQTWNHVVDSPSLRTNYQTWNQTQRQTMNHTAPNDHIPDYPDDTESHFASD